MERVTPIATLKEMQPTSYTHTHIHRERLETKCNHHVSDSNPSHILHITTVTLTKTQGLFLHLFFYFTVQSVLLYVSPVCRCVALLSI